MTVRAVWTWVRLVAVAVGLWGLVRQLQGNLDDPAKSLVMFFSEFTTQSNLLGIVVLGFGIVLAIRSQEESTRFSRLRGASVTYLLLTGIVFYFLVSGTRETTGPDPYSDWAGHVLHRVMPIFLVVDWLVMPPTRRIASKAALWWPLYPVLFCAYSLIRGAFVDWYPYDFLDHRESGWLGVALYVVGIFVGFLLFSQAVVWVGNAMRLRQPVAIEAA